MCLGLEFYGNISLDKNSNASSLFGRWFLETTEGSEDMKPRRGKANKRWIMKQIGLPSQVSGKEYTCQAGDEGSLPGSERSPGKGNGNPLQYSCLENPNRGAWWTTVHGVAKSQK